MCAFEKLNLLIDIISNRGRTKVYFHAQNMLSLGSPALPLLVSALVLPAPKLP
jgi:hypothetical protein